MVSRKFYKKVEEAYKGKSRAVVLTITDIIGKNKDKIEIRIGNKIILKENGDSYIATGGDHLNKDKFLQTVMDCLKEKKEYNLFILNKPCLKKINIAQNLKVEVYIDPFVKKPRMVIFGGGHIARPVAKMGRMINFEVMVIDDREDMVNRTRFPEANYLVCKEFKDFVTDLKINKNDYLIIVTRGHEHDYDVLRRVIDSQAKYIGMLGSSKRVEIIFERLQDVDGVEEKYIKKVKAPVGIPIGSETPEEIAVSIIAQVIAMRRKEGV